MNPRDFANALSRGEKFLDPVSGKIISIYGGPDIMGNVVGFTEDGKMVEANARNLRLANEIESDSEKPSENSREVKNNSTLEDIKKAIENNDEKYLIRNKQKIIENIGDINISRLPEKLRGDIDVMTAAIIDGDVDNMLDLNFVYLHATEKLQSNPRFQMICKHFEAFFKEEEKMKERDREYANSEAVDKYYKALEEKKSEYTQYYNESYAEDEQILDAIQKGDENYLISNKDKLIQCIGWSAIRISQLPEVIRGDIDVMTAAIVNAGVNEMQDLSFVYSQATEELQSDPEFLEIVEDFEEFFNEQSENLDQDRKTADIQDEQKSVDRIKAEKKRYKEWLKIYDRECEKLAKRRDNIRRMARED